MKNQKKFRIIILTMILFFTLTSANRLEPIKIKVIPIDHVKKETPRYYIIQASTNNEFHKEIGMQLKYFQKTDSIIGILPQILKPKNDF